MKISTFKRLTAEGAPEASRDTVNFVGNSVNIWAESVQNAINNNNLSVGDNLNEQIKQITVAVDASGNPIQQTQFQSTLKNKSQGIVVIKASNLTNTTVYPTGAPFVSFSENFPTITILNITGLPAGNQFQLTLRSTG